MLSTTLDLEANPFVAALKGVNEAVDKFQGKITAISSLFSGLHDAAEMVTRTFEKFASVFELGGQLTDLSAATGESTSELLVLQQAFKNVSKGADTVGPAISKLHKALGGVNEEGANTTAAFKALGTSAEALKALPVTEQFKKLSEGFGGISDKADRGQVAMNIFGKSGEEMLAIFKDPEAFTTARTQVGSLGDIMTKIAPVLDTIGDAFGALNRKFQQLVAGFILGTGLTSSFAEAMNAIDLGAIGQTLGHIAAQFFAVAQAVRELVPIIASLGAGWLASMAATQIASVGIIGAVTAVRLATVAAIRAIWINLGPLGIAVAAITYAWEKFHKVAADAKAKAPEAPPGAGSAAKSTSDLSRLGVSSMTSRGLSAFTGVAGLGLGVDPIAAKHDRQISLLTQIVANTSPKQRGEPHTARPNLPV